MRIAFISTNTEWGGSENLWASAAVKALQKNFYVKIYAHEQMRLAKVLNRLQAAGAKVYWWNQLQPWPSIWRRLGKKIFSHPIPQFDWWKENFQSDCDVICINQGTWEEVLRFPQILESIIKSGKPYICLARSDSARGGLNDELRAIGRNFFENAYAYIGASESTLNLARMELLSSLANGCALHSPIRDFSKDVDSFPDLKRVEFACVGRLLCANKGQNLLLQALSSPSWKNRSWRITFYGEGPDKNYISELAAFLGIREKVEFAGNVEDIGRVWANSHALLQPSIIEGVPQSMLEAMLCSRPVIATAVSGIPEWIEDGKTGFLAAAPQVDLLAQTLERAWQSRDSWQKMGLAARESFLAKFEHDPAGRLLEILTRASQSKNITQSTS